MLVKNPIIKWGYVNYRHKYTHFLKIDQVKLFRKKLIGIYWGARIREGNRVGENHGSKDPATEASSG